MFIPTIVMALLAFIFIMIGYFRGEGAHLTGLNAAWKMFYEVLPILIFAFILAGMAQALIPQEKIAQWIGNASGWRGIILGTVAGAFTPGGPYVSFPIVAGLMKSGAGIGTLVAFITSWSLLAFARLPIEVGVIGWRFALIRLLSTAFFPVIAGFIAQVLVRFIH
ncbi:MAG: permease [Candidatus Margulisbacteria bacterium]|nr:permease [Candidatus Margulisiibacteriota bacterium]